MFAKRRKNSQHKNVGAHDFLTLLQAVSYSNASNQLDTEQMLLHYDVNGISMCVLCTLSHMSLVFVMTVFVDLLYLCTCSIISLLFPSNVSLFSMWFFFCFCLPSFLSIEIVLILSTQTECNLLRWRYLVSFFPFYSFYSLIRSVACSIFVSIAKRLSCENCDLFHQPFWNGGEKKQAPKTMVDWIGDWEPSSWKNVKSNKNRKGTWIKIDNETTDTNRYESEKSPVLM